MSILSVDTIQPIGSGTTITLNAAKIVVGTGITFESNGQAIYAGIITATSFSGSGANLTSLPAANLTGTLPAISGANLTSLPAANLTGTLPAISGANLTSLPAQATIANNGNDRIITGGSGVNLNGEANLQFDGTDLYVSDKIKHLGDPDTLIEFATDTITFDTAGSERLRIDANGNVTKPTSFHILVNRNGNQTGYNASSVSDPIIWNRVITGESSSGASSHFNTSTGLFTAPVSGMYFFHIAVNASYVNQGGWLIVNGSRPNYSAFYPNASGSADAVITYHVTAGQTVGVKWYLNGQTNGTINANDLHTWWRIILLG